MRLFLKKQRLSWFLTVAFNFLLVLIRPQVVK
jgi:hypothetical protein